MFDWSSLAAAFLLGLFSSAHCVGMCGGIMGALSMAIPAHAKTRRWRILLSYNLGRIASYGLIGLLAGAMANELAQWGASVWLRWLAGLLLIAMGLYLADWWRGLIYLETLGRYLWAYIQPLGKRFMPVDSIAKAALLGLVWGWLPCGLVYSALVFAMAKGQGVDTGLIMLAFGVGTLPSVLATGMAAQQLGKLLRKPQVRWPLALSIILFGCWTVWGGGHNSQDHRHHHGSVMPSIEDHSTMDHGNVNNSDTGHNNNDHLHMEHSHMHQQHKKHEDSTQAESTQSSISITSGSAGHQHLAH